MIRAGLLVLGAALTVLLVLGLAADEQVALLWFDGVVACCRSRRRGWCASTSLDLRARLVPPCSRSG